MLIRIKTTFPLSIEKTNWLNKNIPNWKIVIETNSEPSENSLLVQSEQNIPTYADFL